MARYLPGIRYSWGWSHHEPAHGFVFDFGFCGNRGSPKIAFHSSVTQNGSATNKSGGLFVCPVCFQPTFVDSGGEQTPGPKFGAELKGLPEDGLKQLYDETRSCYSAGAFTASVMASRKILMNLAVREGAKAGETFASYVNYLAANGFVPPKGKVWVDKIRDKGNEANHEISAMSQQDAQDILHLVEMLLRFNFTLGTP